MADFDWSNAAEPPADFNWEEASKPPAAQAAPAEAPRASLNDAINIGLTQGASLGMAPRLGALGDAMDEWTHGQPVEHPLDTLKAMADRYNQRLPDWQKRYETVEQQRPLATLASGVVGGLASAPRTLAQAMAMGAAQGLGSAKDWGDAKDTALRTTAGAALPLALEGVVGGGRGLLNAVRGRASRGVQEAVDQEAAKQLALTEKNISSQQGTYRSSVQSASRDLEVMSREADALPAGPVKDRLKAYLNSPEALAVREKVALNKLETAPQRVGEMDGELEQLQALTSNKGANTALQTGEALASPFRKHILPRAMTIGARMMPLALGAIGHSIAGLEGAGVGAGLGTVMSLTQGAPGRIIKNALQTPSVRKAGWQALLSATPQLSESAGRFALPALTSESVGPDGYMNALIQALRQRPEMAAGPLQQQEQGLADGR